MTPEQVIRGQLKQVCTKILPKGRFLLQPIETNTVGVHDFYLTYSLDQGKTNHTVWLETKTTDYKVDRFQLNWSHLLANTGTASYVLTHIPTPTAYHHATSPQAPTLPRQPLPPSSPSGLYLLSFDGKMLDYSTLGGYISKEKPAMLALEDYLLNR